jgi:hypothetical protein
MDFVFKKYLLFRKILQKTGLQETYYPDEYFKDLT